MANLVKYCFFYKQMFRTETPAEPFIVNEIRNVLLTVQTSVKVNLSRRKKFEKTTPLNNYETKI